MFNSFGLLISSYYNKKSGSSQSFGGFMGITFEPMAYWWVAVAAAAAAVIAAGIAFARVRRAAGLPRAAALLALRFAAVAAVLLYVLAPGWVYEAARSAASPVAILVDSSASMDLDAADGTRLAASLAAAGEVREAVRSSGGRCVVHDFAASRRPWGDAIPAEETLREGGAGRQRTDAAGALREVTGLYGEKGLAAAVVLSDGAWDAAPAAEGLPPCYAMAPAVEPPAGRVFVTGVEAPGVVLPGTDFDARIDYYSTASEGAVTAHVAEGDGPPADFIIKPGEGAGTATVRARVAEAGDHFFRVWVSPGWGETWFHVDVLDRPMNVWYWEMAGDADFAFLKRALTAQAGFRVDYRLDVGDAVLGSAARPPDNTDVIILGNPRAGPLGAAEADAVERHVARGGGLLIIVDARPVSTAALSRGALAGLLPVRAHPHAVEGRGGELSATSYPGVPAVAAAPPTVTHVWHLGSLKESATPLWRSADGAPALAVMPYGLGRVALLSAGGLYRWQLSRGGDELKRLAAALMLVLYNEHAEALAVSRHVVERGDAVEVTCRSGVEPAAAYGHPDGAVKRVALAPAGEGLWVGEIEADAEGNYEITARLTGGAGAEIEKTTVVATPESAEYGAYRPRPERLQALAEATGGRYFGPAEADALAHAVAARVREAPRVTVPGRRALWPAWLAFPAALMFLAVEWFLRRRAGLP
jgi:hypothetical protein